MEKIEKVLVAPSGDYWFSADDVPLLVLDDVKEVDVRPTHGGYDAEMGSRYQMYRSADGRTFRRVGK